MKQEKLQIEQQKVDTLLLSVCIYVLKVMDFAIFKWFLSKGKAPKAKFLSF